MHFSNDNLPFKDFMTVFIVHLVIALTCWRFIDFISSGQLHNCFREYKYLIWFFFRLRLKLLAPKSLLFNKKVVYMQRDCFGTSASMAKLFDKMNPLVKCRKSSLKQICGWIYEVSFRPKVYLREERAPRFTLQTDVRWIQSPHLRVVPQFQQQKTSNSNNHQRHWFTICLAVLQRLTRNSNCEAVIFQRKGYEAICKKTSTRAKGARSNRTNAHFNSRRPCLPIQL